MPGDPGTGGDLAAQNESLQELVDVFILRDDLIKELRAKENFRSVYRLEAAIEEIGAHLIQYCYAEIFSLVDLVRLTAEAAGKNGLPNALERVLDLWGLSLEDDPRLEPLRAEGMSRSAKTKGRTGKGSANLDTARMDETLGEASIWQLNADGKIRPNEANALKALELMRVKLAYDEFRREIQLEGLRGYGPGLDRDSCAELYLAIQREFYFRVPLEDLERIARSAARRNAFDPVTDYLDNLRWDGMERLDEWLVTYAGAEDSPYVREVGSKFMMAAVRRARHPGCKFDYMPIFEGEEGRGKSSVGAVLAGPEFFTDSIPIHSHDPRHTIEALRGKWICEAGELAAIKRSADVETVKAWLSRTTDTGTLKWERDSTGVPRRFVTFGTVNPDGMGYFESKTGNRRFWPVAVRGFDLPAIAVDRDQLWAEAAWREARGETLELSADVRPMALAAQKERENRDEWENMLHAWAAHPEPEFIKSTIPKVVEGSMMRIAETVFGIERSRFSRADQMRVGVALGRLGFKKRHTERGSVWSRTTYEL